jgi:hypothetical protein
VDEFVQEQARCDFRADRDDMVEGDACCSCEARVIKAEFSNCPRKRWGRNGQRVSLDDSDAVEIG